MSSNRTGGVSENTSVDESIREFGFNGVKVTEQQARDSRISALLWQVESAKSRIEFIKDEIETYIADRNARGWQPTAYVLSAFNKRIGIAKQAIVAAEMELEALGANKSEAA
jgi:hypothetical protein